MTVYRACHQQNRWVQLTKAEVDYCWEVAHHMREHSRTRGQKDHRMDNEKPYDEAKALRIQFSGCCAELGGRKYFGYELKLTTENYRRADCPDNVEIKLLGVDHYGLRLYPRTNDTRRCVGIVCEKDRELEPMRIPGWIVAGDGKRPEWSINPWNGKPMWAVPQDQLLSIDTLDTPSSLTGRYDTKERLRHG